MIASIQTWQKLPAKVLVTLLSKAKSSMLASILRTKNYAMTRSLFLSISAPTSLIQTNGKHPQNWLTKFYWVPFFQSLSQHSETDHSLIWQKKPQFITHTWVSLFQRVNSFSLALTRAIANQKNLAKCLVEIDKQYKPQQVEPIYKLVGKLNDLASIFLNCLT